MQFFKLALAVASIGSAIAVPTTVAVQEVRDTTVVSSVYTAVTGIKALVDAELTTIGNSVIGLVDATVVPVVNDALANVATELNGVISVVTPIVNDMVFPLVAAEMTAVPEVMIEVYGIVSNITTTIKEAVAALPQGKN